MPFGYCGICYGLAVKWDTYYAYDGLQCLSAIAVFVTRLITVTGAEIAVRSSVPFGYCGICYSNFFLSTLAKDL